MLVVCVVNDLTVCADNPDYSGLNVSVGESVELRCNTSLTSDMMWTYDNDGDSYVDYVYWKGDIASDKPRLSVKSSTAGVHSLVITNTKLRDSGYYDCYDGHGMRKIGYEVAGMKSIF